MPCKKVVLWLADQRKSCCHTGPADRLVGVGSSEAALWPMDGRGALHNWGEATEYGALRDDAISQYESKVNRLPLLTRAEEIECGREAQRDKRCADELVLSNLRFVVPIARGYTGFHQSLSDLVQEGNLGLLKAVPRFSRAIGVRFIQFARQFVHAEIRDFILRNRRLVYVPLSRDQQDLYFRMHKLTIERGVPSNDLRVAARLKVRPVEIRRLRSSLHGREVSLDAVARGAGSEQTMEQCLVDRGSVPLLREQDADHERHLRGLEIAVEDLAPRIGDIVRRRWLVGGKRPSLRQLAREQGVSGERMRQLEARALQLIRNRLTEAQD